MYFMNEYEIDEARARWRGHPVLGPATATLSNLRDATNRNSDAWAYAGARFAAVVFKRRGKPTADSYAVMSLEQFSQWARILEAHGYLR